MKELTINNCIRPYRVYYDANMDQFINILNENKIKKNEKIFIITDQNVAQFYKKYFESLKESFEIFIYVLKPGESNKDINAVIKIYDFLLINNCHKNSVIIAFGGGIVGDLAGFASSTYMCGVRFINVPTTLLSQVDNCIGGKTGFNFDGTQNLIGSYCNPQFVFISTGFLKTLKSKSFTDGFGEVIKYGVMKDRALLKFLSENSIPILEMENDKLFHIIRESLKLKAQVIEEDISDIGALNILDFGHTAGYAIEVCSKHMVSHGNAVALGMLFAIKLSEEILHTSTDIYFMVEKIINGLGLLSLYKVEDYDTFFSALKRDKKMLNEINFVLLLDLNQSKIKTGITKKQILNALKNSISREG